MTQNTFMATVEKIKTYMVGGHNPGSTQAERTSIEMKSVEPWYKLVNGQKLEISEDEVPFSFESFFD